jgi:hypothetical protein
LKSKAGWRLSLSFEAKMQDLDWVALGKAVDSLKEQGESVNLQKARAALDLIVGKDVCQNAVEHYVSGGRSSELACKVLRLFRSRFAAEYCYNIFKSNRPLQNQRLAVCLLRDLCDHGALPWIKEFLVSPDPDIQYWGADILNQMLWDKIVYPDDRDFIETLSLLKQHTNKKIRELAEEIEARF